MAVQQGADEGEEKQTTHLKDTLKKSHAPDANNTCRIFTNSVIVLVGSANRESV
jgi:hypothetical protein